MINATKGDGFVREDNMNGKIDDIDDPLLFQIIQRLVNAYHPDHVYLFGSRGRGEGGPDSDYDLLLVVADSPDPPYRRAQRAQEILWGIWEAVDVLILTRNEFESLKSEASSIPATVMTEGRELYAA